MGVTLATRVPFPTDYKPLVVRSSSHKFSAFYPSRGDIILETDGPSSTRHDRPSRSRLGWLIDREAVRRCEFGPIESVKDRVRDARAGASLDMLRLDLRYAARLLRRTSFVDEITLMAVLRRSRVWKVGWYCVKHAQIDVVQTASCPFSTDRPIHFGYACDKCWSARQG
jgi:hypothetical protein